MLKNINNPFEFNTFKMIFERKYFFFRGLAVILRHSDIVLQKYNPKS